MPHRDPNIQAFFSHVVEGSVLGFLAIWQGLSAYAATISEQDWSKIFGPNGVAFVSVIAVVVLWSALLMFIHRSKKSEEQRRKEELEMRAKEDESRERRHKEIMEMQTKNAEDLKSLTAESIKANMKGTFAIETLIARISERPCQAATFKPSSEPCPAPANNQ